MTVKEDMTTADDSIKYGPHRINSAAGDYAAPQAPVETVGSNPVRVSEGLDGAAPDEPRGCPCPGACSAIPLKRNADRYAYWRTKKFGGISWYMEQEADATIEALAAARGKA